MKNVKLASLLLLGFFFKINSLAMRSILNVAAVADRNRPLNCYSRHSFGSWS